MRSFRSFSLPVRFAALLSLAASAAAPAAAAQEPVLLSASVDVGLQPRVSALGDLNHDGFTDLVAGGAAPLVSVRLGQANGTWAPPVTFAAVGDILSMALADLDEDGTLDLVLGSGALAGQDPIVVRLGVGNGTFGPPSQFLVPSTPADIEVADMDHDTHLDLVVPCQAGTRVAVLYGVGDGSFRGVAQFAAGNQPNSAAVGDLNGDTFADVVVGLSFSADVAVMLNDGAGGLLAPSIEPIVPNVADVALGDVNADGKLDVVVGNFGLDVLLLPGLGGGDFGPAITLPPLGNGGGSPRSVAVADFDEDGVGDVAAVKSFFDVVYVFRSHGDLAFDQAVGYGTVHQPQRVSTADANGDGDLDLVVIGSDSLAGHALTVLNGRGDGTFALNFNTGESPASTVAFGDLDGDGRKEMLVGNASTGDIDVFHALGLGGFAQTGTLVVGQQPTSLALADFDEDGALDLAAVGGLGGLQLFFGDGDGGFGPGLPFGFPAGTGPIKVRAFDVDGDQHQDLVMLCNTSFIGDHVQVNLGHGNGLFQGATVSGITDAPQDFALGDFNGDGDVDVAVVFNPISTQWGNVEVLLGDGSSLFGGLAVPLTVAAGANSSVLAVGDLNGDELDDLVTASILDSLIYTRLSNGDGTFGPLVATDAPGEQPQSLAVADLDRDGTNDVVCTLGHLGQQSGLVGLLHGLGNGTFGAVQTPAVGWQPSSVTVADVDGDGALDAAVTTSGGQVDVLLNQLGPWNVLGKPLAGSKGLPKQTGEGTLQGGQAFEIALHDARPNAQVAHFVGLALLNAPFKGGVMVPRPDLINAPLFTDADGDLSLGGHWPLFGFTGVKLYFQFWLQDPAGIKGWASSAALEATLP